MSMVALISGITDQDGPCLAEFQLEKGYEVHGIKRHILLSAMNASAFVSFWV